MVLPARRSATVSVGISMRPNFSVNPNASTRLRRLSATLRSKPEYVWMMYHCLVVSDISLIL